MRYGSSTCAFSWRVLVWKHGAIEGEKTVATHFHAIQVDEQEIANAPILFQEYYPRIFRYIGSMVRDTAEAEDLTQ